ncbi:MAG: H-NS family nucleoid-associated regulatory protein [Stenotrophomonas sp.]|uniref:H-NS family nucleoid-associated regulatory protein n=1 Tax=Stenotrophomonas sp. TaxID=69392 RepID=UPI002FCA49ED
MARADQDGPAVLRAATQEAFKRVTLLLERSYPDFSADQQRRIRALVATEPTAPPAERIKRPAREPLPPRFWLPHSGATWSGRGRVPQAFLAWEGTVAHTEWKKHHPDQRFPTYPG